MSVERKMLGRVYRELAWYLVSRHHFVQAVGGIAAVVALLTMRSYETATDWVLLLPGIAVPLVLFWLYEWRITLALVRDVNSVVFTKSILDFKHEAERVIGDKVRVYFLTAAGENSLRVTCRVSENDGLSLRRFYLKRDVTPEGEAVKGGMPVVIDNLASWTAEYRCASMPGAGRVLRTCVALPMKVGERVVGVVSLDTDKHVGPEQVEMVKETLQGMQWLRSLADLASRLES